MLVHEERLVLAYLHHHPACTTAEVFRKCLPGVPLDWAQRILSNLEWLGYITVFPTMDGLPTTVQITSKGHHSVNGTRSGQPTTKATFQDAVTK